MRIRQDSRIQVARVGKRSKRKENRQMVNDIDKLLDVEELERRV
jgi:hypothetical protein